VRDLSDYEKIGVVLKEQGGVRWIYCIYLFASDQMVHGTHTKNDCFLTA